MTTQDEKQEKKEARWQLLWQQPKKRYLLYIPAGGLLMFVAGIIFWGAFHTAIEATNTEEFCISCHEMRDNVYAEYKETIHYKNPAGVRATCPDCHVPRPWVYKIMRKIQASNELLHKVLGTIDTREKFLAHRAELAQHVWDTMKATNSRECRNCHAQTFMDIEKQDRIAQKKHASMTETGKTCIDCHKGIAHQLPEGGKDS
jgi:nitrate/TMAO reductase-like tetraheme cytochrome c subunit